jgi:hypothetical protein
MDIVFGSDSRNRPTDLIPCYHCDVSDEGGPRFEPTEEAVPEHKFRIGQSVNYRSPFDRGETSGVYTVTRLLPPAGGDYQYRIKNADEPHERVVKESQLHRVA